MLKPSSPVTANLIKARELIADERNWCQRSYSTLMGQHCAVGALAATYSVNDETFEGCHALLIKAARTLRFTDAEDLNDSTDHATTILMFDRAIELSLQDA